MSTKLPTHFIPDAVIQKVQIRIEQ